MLTLSAEELWALRRYDVTPPREARKVIFSLRLWRPLRQRLRQQRLHRSGFSHSTSIHTEAVALGCVNARSVGNKAALICQTVVDNRLDLLLITETWHENSDSVSLKRMTPTGFQCVDAARPIPADINIHTDVLQNYGGLALIHRDGVKVSKKSLDVTVTTFEFLYVVITVGNASLSVFGIYRPGSQTVTSTFFDELSSVLEQISLHTRQFVICGDLNIHVDDCNDSCSVRLAELLESFDCVQHVDEPTQRRSHSRSCHHAA